MPSVIIHFDFRIDENDNDDCFLLVLHTSIDDKFKFVALSEADAEANKNWNKFSDFEFVNDLIKW